MVVIWSGPVRSVQKNVAHHLTALVLVLAMFINRHTLPPGLIRKPAGW